jgi:hypothetical protein
MSIFKNKNVIPKTSNASVDVQPVARGLNPATNMVEYVISIESNMAELINEDINEIEIVTVAKPRANNMKKDQANISKIVKDTVKSSFDNKTRKMASIDPKMSIGHGDLGKSKSEQIKDEIIRETPTYSEKTFKPLPILQVDFGKVLAKKVSYDAQASKLSQKSNLSSGIFSADSPKISKNLFTPLVKFVKQKIVPKKTVITSIIKVSKNETIKINLKNKNGKTIGTVGKSAAKVEQSLHQSNNPKYLSVWKILTRKKPIFNITMSENSAGFYVHVSSKFSNSITEFQLFVRRLSAAPEKDRYQSLGVFNSKSTPAIKLAVDSSSGLMFNVVPRVEGKNMCWSQTYVHQGINAPTTANINSYQVSRGGTSGEALEFKIYNYPRNASKLYAIRENLLSGEKIRLSAINITLPDGTGKSEYYVDYIDKSIALVNSVYQHDFFTIDKWGLESHVGNKISRVFEKDISGIIFRKSSINSINNVHEIKFSVFIPDLWIPLATDDLNNPEDSIFEACRQQKKIGLLQLVRHSSRAREESRIIDTFVINPSKNVSDIPVELTEELSVSGKFVIDSDFSSRYGLTRIRPGVDYTYELRVGYYLLSNELSFLQNPVKLTVPNEFTDGKVGYSYHPYIYDSPLSKDFGIIPKLGESKHKMKVESLTNKAVILTIPGETNTVTSPFNLKCKLGAQGKSEAYVIIEATIPKTAYNEMDHVELLYANSSNGSWTSLGKHKLSSGKFYYIDTIAPAIAANKIKYALIGRNYAMERIFNTISLELDLKTYNYIEKPRNNSNKLSSDKIKNSKLR